MNNIFNNARAIIIRDGRLVVMERERAGQKYCAFPGGHIEGGETVEECVKREVMEEFGIVVNPIRHLYTYKFNGKLQAFFLCDWVEGQIHITDGEEYQPDRNRGSYNPTTIALREMQEKNVVPPEIREQLIKDLKEYGTALNRKTIIVETAE